MQMNPQKIIQEVKAAGLTERQIADRIGCSQPHVNGLATGKKGARISFELGVALQRLHLDLVGASGAPPIKEQS